MKHYAKNKKHSLVFQILIYFFLFLFLVGFSGILLIQSPPGRHYIKKQIEALARDEGVILKIKKTKMPLPLELELFRVQIQINQKFSVEIDKARVKLSLWSLIFFKKLVFSSLEIHEAKIIEKNQTPMPPKESKEVIENYHLPYPVFVRSLGVEKCVLPNLQVFKLSGELLLSKNFSKIFFHLLADNLLAKDFLSFETKINGNQADDSFLAKIKTKGSAKNLGFQDQNTVFDLKAKAHGHFKDFIGFVKNSTATFPLKGQAKGSLTHSFPSYPFLPEKTLFSSSFFVDGFKEFAFSNLILNNSLITFEGLGHFTKKTLDQLKLDFFLRSTFQKTPFAGQISGTILAKKDPSDEKTSYEVNLSSKNIFFKNLPTLENIHGHFIGHYDQGPVGTFKLDAKTLDELLTLSLSLKRSEEKLLAIDSLNLSMPSLQATGVLDLSKQGKIIGKIDGTLKNFPFSKFLAWKNFSPQCDQALFSLHFDEVSLEEKNSQLLHIEADFVNLMIKKFSSTSLKLYSSIKDLFKNPKLNLILLSKRGSFQNFSFEELEFKSSNFEKCENPFELFLRGNLKDPFFISSQGSWSTQDDLEKKIVFQSIHGSIFKENFSNKTPLIFIGSDFNHFALQDFEILLSDQSLKGHLFYENLQKFDLALSCSRFPLDFLSLLNTGLERTKGFAKIETSLICDPFQQNGSFLFEIEDLKAFPSHKKEPFNMAGSLKINLKNQRLSFVTDLKYKNAKELQLCGSLPIEIKTFFPLSIQLDPKKNLVAQGNFEGRLEEVLDFFNTGPHEIEGAMTLQFTLGGTIQAPHFEGRASLRGGKYENYLTGTSLQEIEGYFKAEKDLITVERLVGKDRGHGKFSLNGKMECLLKKQCPFLIDVELKDLLCVQSDPMSATVRGKAEITGTLKSAKVTGDLILTEGELAIPEKIPDPLVDFPVTFYPNRPEEKSTNLFVLTKVYPLFLDVSLKIPQNLRISGQGINSLWEGNVTLSGQFDTLLPKGSLDLVKGDFIFSGHNFDLTRGELIFTGKRPDLARFSLEGKTVIQGVNISATLTGPLLAPTLTFTSTPPLALSSILSLILFGQDLSELSALQAVQLASSIASISSATPSLLETTRKKLGIDRLAVVSTPAKNIDEPEKTAIQIGKYITKGILVTFSQGMEQDTSNIIVEVDIGKGFVLQAETQQEEEQGKFTLKWNLSY